MEDIPPGVEAVRLPERFIHKAGSILLAVPRIKAEIRKFQPQIINALFIPNYGWAGALSGFAPLVISAWGSDVLISPRKSWLHRRRVSWAMSKADLLFSDARVITERMIELGADRQRIITVPLGIDPALLARQLDKSSADDRCTIITNRKFEPLYHNDTFVEAAVQLAQANTSMKFVLIGEGRTRAELEERVQRAGLRETIMFRPFLAAKDLYDELAAGDIYVSCSASDGTSVSLLESLALGLYPLVTDIPANREWIKDGVNGRLFPVGDAAALARVILEVSKDRHQWPEVIDRNRALIKERALWPDNMAQVERAMMRLIE
ncbi:glycosyltransferase [Candidatus Zixiibacteriota bacterium]